MLTAILQFFGRFLLWLYNFCHSYALALILFTLLIRLVLFPLSLKSKKSMMQTSALSAEMQRLQKQYAKDQQRLQEETQKLYQREGVNPMSGCLWSFLPLPILMALYSIIRQPMLYMMCLTQEQIAKAVEAVRALPDAAALLNNASDAYIELRIAGLLGNPEVMTAVQNAVGEGASKLEVMNFNMFGIDLSQIPTLKFWTTFETLGVWGSIGLFLVPFIVIAVQFGYTKLSQWTNSWNGSQQNGDDAAQRSTKMMMYMMPLMYLWFGFIMPAGMCVYMTASSVFMAIQELICAKMLKGDFEQMRAAQEQRALEAKEAEKAKKAEIAARRAAQEAEAKVRGAKKKKKAKGGVAAQKDHPTADSRVGIRAYARGRAYDPNRYPVTPYRDPADVIDEAALEATYKKRGHKVETADEEPASLLELGEVKETAVETPAAPAPSADEVFASIQNETAGEGENA